MNIVTSIINLIIENWEISLAFFIIALLYASVGFGGGSSYLAILALMNFEISEMRTIALLCNIVVVSGSVYIFQKNKLLDWKKVIPLSLISVPFAFLGGMLKINESIYFILLGSLLFIAAMLMWTQKETILEYKKPEKNTISNLGIGGIIGFFSGMIGIGGGIFLAPILHLSKWDNAKKIAATSSFFILANSISGLIGQSFQSNFNINYKLTTLLIFTVFVGGQIGTRLNTTIFSALVIKRATAVLIFFVAFRILYKYLLI